MDIAEKRPITAEGIWRWVAIGIITIRNFMAAIKKFIFKLQSKN
jgi:hypothetical protein